MLEEFERHVRYYLTRLGLDDWEVWVSQERLDPTRFADCNITVSTKQAWIRLAMAYRESYNPAVQEANGGPVCVFPMSLEFIAAHEVLHILVYSYWEAVQALISVLPGDSASCRVLAKTAEEAEDTLVNRLAKILVEEKCTNQNI